MILVFVWKVVRGEREKDCCSLFYQWFVLGSGVDDIRFDIVCAYWLRKPLRTQEVSGTLLCVALQARETRNSWITFSIFDPSAETNGTRSSLTNRTDISRSHVSQRPNVHPLDSIAELSNSATLNGIDARFDEEDSPWIRVDKDTPSTKMFQEVCRAVFNSLSGPVTLA